VGSGCFVGLRKLGCKEMWVGSADFQITFWGPEKKVQGVVIWFVLENVL